MEMMRRGAIVTAILLIFFLVASRSDSQTSVAQKETRKAEFERGRYLVEEVAKCAECHTPRDSQGNLDRDKWLQGGTIWIMPVHRVRNWAERVPPLAGFPGMTEEQGERVLEQGTGPNGEPLRPPMHIYHLRHEDARAIIAYLRSLPQATP
jgi:mono/diheme cytochrome c family protein